MKYSNFLKVLITLTLTVFTTFFLYSQPKAKEFQDWPKGASPKEVGEKVSERFIATPHPDFSDTYNPTKIIYPEVCTWYGALKFARTSKNSRLMDRLVQRFERLMNEDSSLVPKADHVDHSVFGAIPLEIFRHTKQQKYILMGKAFADQQWNQPEGKYATPEASKYFQEGFSWQTRMWIDDMFMISTLQAQAFRVTNDLQYIERAAKEMVLYLDKLQKPNGLFYHAADVPFYWGRGNGWMAAGMTELLISLPASNPDRARILQGYRTMMASLLKYQTGQGMWRQLIDEEQSWPETSCTGMFTYAMISGVKHGWLNSKIYAAAARKAWLALISYINENGDLQEICEGTNKMNDRNHYLNRGRKTGDMHGQAPVLWCAAALLE